MYMGRVITSPEREILSELTGARVMITGLGPRAGVDVARAFADLGTRLVVHTRDLSPDITELFAHLSQRADEIKLYTSDISTADGATEFAKTSSQAFGGLDAVVNITHLTMSDIAALTRASDVEEAVGAMLAPVAHLTQVVANRMRLVCREGMILNVVRMPRPSNGRECALAGFIRTALAAMTISEARNWATSGIRINAVGPSGTLPGFDDYPLGNEPDVAALALYLASRRGQTLSGQLFDAELDG